MAKDINQQSTGSLEAVSRWLIIITPGSRSSILSYHLQRTRLLESDQNRQTHLWYRIPINKFIMGQYFFSVIKTLEPVTKTQNTRKCMAMKNIRILQQSTSPVTRKFLQPDRACPHPGRHQSVWTVLSTCQVHKKRLFLNRDVRESLSGTGYSALLCSIFGPYVVPSSHFDNQIHCHTFPTLLLLTPPPSPHVGRWPQLRTSTSTYPNHQPPYRPPCRKLPQ